MDERSPGFVPVAGCTKLILGTVSERPKEHVSKTCVGVNSTVGSNPTGTAKRLFADSAKFICESQAKKKPPRDRGFFRTQPTQKPLKVPFLTDTLCSVKAFSTEVVAESKSRPRMV